MKFFKSLLILFLVGVVSCVTGTAGNITAVSDATTTTTTVVYNSTILATASNGLTLNPARNTTAACNNSIVTTTVTKNVSVSLYFIETLTVFIPMDGSAFPPSSGKLNP